MKVKSKILKEIERELTYAELKHPKQQQRFILEWVEIAEEALKKINKYNTCGIKGCKDCLGNFVPNYAEKVITVLADDEKHVRCKLLATIAILIRCLTQYPEIRVDCRKAKVKETRDMRSKNDKSI